ncbi:MAG TPA: cell division protein FtsZ [Bacilli bacterium]|nr:cell division protein FtsZ [Bacilli bacterium]
MNNLDNFEPVAKIVVVGVGGAGNNAVNRMIDEQIDSVTFWVANTDKQALSTSKARNRIVLGEDFTNGLGAGGDPAVGKRAAEHSAEELEEIVKGANLVFIAAGMGGGTGTGAAPVVAEIAKQAGALTIAIVTRPFTFEGKQRIANSVEGLNNLKGIVDSIIVVSNDKLLMVSGNLPVGKAFAESDKVLAQSVKTVVDLILVPAVINLDFADVKNTLLDSGIALIGFGQGSGKNKARDAAQAAINSPLLEASLQGARKAIVSVTCGTNVSLYEAQETVNSIIETSGSNVDVKFGVALNDLLEDDIIVSIIASDFEEEYDFTRPGPTQPPIALPQDYVAPDHEEDDDIIDIFPDFLREQEDEFPN